MFIKSRYNSTCDSTGSPIKKGEEIYFERPLCRGGKGRAHCCKSSLFILAKSAKNFIPDYSDIAYEDSCARACGLI